MRDFRRLQVWKRTYHLANEIYIITSSFPMREKYGIISQMRRCAVSIPSNMTEGCSRFSKRELRRNIEIAMGSSFELETQLLIAQEKKMTKSDIDSPLKELRL